MTRTSAATRRDDLADTTPDRSLLSQPFELPNGFVIPNRLAKAALSEGLARRDFTPGTRIRNLYQRWAESGVGLSITGNVMIDRRHGIGEPGNVVVEDHSHSGQS